GKRLVSYTEEVRTSLRDARIPYQSVERRGDESIVANLNPSAGEGAGLCARDALYWAEPALGNGVSGSRVTVTLPQAGADAIAKDAIEQNVNTLRNRDNQLGVAEPIIQR